MSNQFAEPGSGRGFFCEIIMFGKRSFLSGSGSSSWSRNASHEGTMPVGGFGSTGGTMNLGRSSNDF